MRNIGNTLKKSHDLFNKSKIPNLNPEFFHNIAIGVSKYIENNKSIVEAIREATYVPGEENLTSNIGDLEFPNPVGLAAGFVKEPVGLKFWEAFGFGSMTIGGVTGKAQPGNKKQRIFRVQNGIVNGMGLPGNSAYYVANMLSKRQYQKMMPNIPLGANLCNSASTKPEDKIREFRDEMHVLYKYVDYFEINISCPNQAGVCGLQSELNEILKDLTEYNKQLSIQFGLPRKKLLVKISPLTQKPDNPEDGTIEGLQSIADTCNNYTDEGVDAIIATNTAKEHQHKNKTKIWTQSGDIITGGASGKQIQETSLRTVYELRKILDKNIPIIGVGGIGYDEKGKQGQSGVNMIRAGADSLQLLSSFVQDGTVMIARDVKQALVHSLHK